MKSRKGEHWLNIREHQRADLTTNARVCLHAEAVGIGSFLFHH
ncbi:hypothetical protein [Bacillus pumilus]